MTEVQGASIAAPDRSPCPLRNDDVTLKGVSCPVCGDAFLPRGRRRFCSDACRQAAWRRRHPGPEEPASIQDGEPPRASTATVYECPSCSTRYLGERRCPDCQLFCRKVGPGGACPHCDEPVAITDLIAGR